MTPMDIIIWVISTVFLAIFVVGFVSSLVIVFKRDVDYGVGTRLFYALLAVAIAAMGVFLWGSDQFNLGYGNVLGDRTTVAQAQERGHGNGWGRGLPRWERNGMWGYGFVDVDRDGICDNWDEAWCGCGQGFVDEDGDGVCDNFESVTSQDGIVSFASSSWADMEQSSDARG